MKRYFFLSVFLVAFAALAHAQVQTCAGATVSTGPGAVSILLSGCSAGTTVPPVVVTPPVIVSAPPVVFVPPSPPITIGGGDFSADGGSLPNPSKRAFQPTSHGGISGAGSEVNAYAMNPARCVATPALSRSWQHNIDLADYKSKNAFDFFVMQANESLSYKFTVGDVDASGGFIYNDAANATVRPTFMSISTAPCDFPVGLIGRSPCYQTGLNGNSINWANITGALPISYCRLVKGQTYYINLRFQDARPAALGGSPTTDSCLGGNCGGILQVL